MTLLSTPPAPGRRRGLFLRSEEVVINAIAQTTFPLRREAESKTGKREPRSTAVLVSLVLHAIVALLLIRVVTHQQGAPLPKKAVTVIALQSLLPAVPAPSAEAPHLAPAKPRSRPRQAVAKAAPPAAAWQTPPAPTPQPPPAPPAETVAAAPAPPVPVPDPAPTAIAASSAAAPPAAASAQLDAPLPIAYLTEVSRMIRVHLNYPAQTHKHGIAVVHIRIGRDGTVLGAGVVQSSGNQALDEEAEAVVLRIHQFPEPPSAYVSAIGDFVIDQPIRFMG